VRAAGHYPLGPIAASHWIPFIREKFLAGDKKIADEHVLEIHDLTQGHPFYTQHLCHALWERCEPRTTVTSELIGDALELLLERESFAYSTLWESFTNNQRRFLKGLAAEPDGVQPFSSAFVQRYGLRSSSNAQRAVEPLLKRDVLDRDNGSFIFLDRFFRLWVGGGFRGRRSQPAATYEKHFRAIGLGFRPRMSGQRVRPSAGGTRRFDS
jgi:hypothetical protein